MCLHVVVAAAAKYFPLRPLKTHAIRKQMVHTSTGTFTCKRSTRTHLKNGRHLSGILWKQKSRRSRSASRIIQALIQKHKHTVNERTNERINERWTNDVKANAEQDKARQGKANHWCNALMKNSGFVQLQTQLYDLVVFVPMMCQQCGTLHCSTSRV